MILISSCSRVFSIHWSQVLSREWRYSCSSADRPYIRHQYNVHKIANGEIYFWFLKRHYIYVVREPIKCYFPTWLVIDRSEAKIKYSHCLTVISIFGSCWASWICQSPSKDFTISRPGILRKRVWRYGCDPQLTVISPWRHKEITYVNISHQPVSSRRLNLNECKFGTCIANLAIWCKINANKAHGDSTDEVRDSHAGFSHHLQYGIHRPESNRVGFFAIELFSNAEPWVSMFYGI